MARKVKLFAISTCGWCKKTKNFLNENNIEYEFEDVDLLEGEEKERAREEVARHNPRKSYPTIRATPPLSSTTRWSSWASTPTS